MSTNKILLGSLVAAFGITGLATTADAQSSRYGSSNSYGNVYDYESGRYCGNACAPAQTYPGSSSRYGSTATQPAY